MKLKNIWLLLLMSVFAFQACEDDLDPKLDTSKVKITTNEIGIDEFEVTNENSGLEAFKIVWEEESDSLNLDLNTTHIVQFDVVGNNFSQAKTFTQLESKSHSVIAKDLNKFLITNFAQEYNTAKEYEFRVVLAVIGKDNLIAPLPQTALNSQIIKVTVIELKREPIYIVGDGLVGWNNNGASDIGDNLQVLFADNNDSDMKYTYTSFFKSGGMKFVTEAGEWGTAYGATSSTTEAGIEIYNLELGKGDNVFTPEKEGVYTLTIERVKSTLTAKLTPYDGEVKEYKTVGLMGTAAISWDTPLPLIKVAEHVWVAKNVEMKDGEFKFKGDGDWWGIDKSELPFGIANGDSNIKISAGTYYVAFNDLTKHFVVIPMADLPVKK